MHRKKSKKCTKGETKEGVKKELRNVMHMYQLSVVHVIIIYYRHIPIIINSKSLK